MSGCRVRHDEHLPATFFTYGSALNDSSGGPMRLANISFDNRSTLSRFHIGEAIMFMVLNPRSASADVTGIVSTAACSSARSSGFWNLPELR